ncbi:MULTISPECIES: TetR/AcrR family transcriptional regulator [unclassified Mycolicibacterium]|uniref:TetR/AcrR family transcriptional regulator n=1 Tax=unclassified Mycolicibacterium TaxID=2636767 RepID=UPI001306F21C|nr:MULTISPECIES: TetR/AcrR family transcriptional regulator [unclassified Mycolicibacterium]MUL80923.1 TetR/AcrR family transcriptional regulator [Mycolicibacterium sp. CBMA 329]MUL86689.1 TetR/AcrR family transcriptional regulator [Mycolicibacterium sp. CBMA 331]MUM02892.1 TetR/AcrR family transcriptional regulator [Mycolicibacterium sp. CBMA 334]MUM28848.1 TetR/AcrR family transcriptional regulator [Mycolicibacterium sp. CBMA 295]MUM36986.1 TetR/AcrR family transcriptional regulator [Mycolic
MTSVRGRPRSFDRDTALDKAILLFWERGYEATSTRDLGSALGIGIPSIYAAFGDKQRLFTEAVRVYDERYGGFINAALSEEPTARQAFARILVEAPARYTRRGLPNGCLIVSGDDGATDPAVRAGLQDIRRQKTGELADKVSADIAAGNMPAETDAPALAQYVMSTLSGLAQAARDRVPRATLDQVAEIALRALP